MRAIACWACNEKDALGLAFKDIIHSIGVRQHVSGPTHCRNHSRSNIITSMLILLKFCKAIAIKSAQISGNTDTHTHTRTVM